MTTVSMREYARSRGISESAVRKAVAEGRVTRDHTGKLDPAIADVQWAANTLPPKSGKSAAPATEQESGGHVGAYLEARARKELANAKRAELDYAEASGELCPAALMGEYAAGFSVIVRDSLMAIPDRLSPGLAALAGDEKAIHRVLTAELTAVLRKMSKAIEDTNI